MSAVSKIILSIGGKLSGPLGYLLSFVLNWLWGKVWGTISTAVSAWWQRRQERKAIEAKNRAVREQTEKAVTPKEREDAAKNVANKF